MGRRNHGDFQVISVTNWRERGRVGDLSDDFLCREEDDVCTSRVDALHRFAAGQLVGQLNRLAYNVFVLKSDPTGKGELVGGSCCRWGSVQGPTFADGRQGAVAVGKVQFKVAEDLGVGIAFTKRGHGEPEVGCAKHVDVNFHRGGPTPIGRFKFHGVTTCTQGVYGEIVGDSRGVGSRRCTIDPWQVQSGPCDSVQDGRTQVGFKAVRGTYSTGYIQQTIEVTEGGFGNVVRRCLRNTAHFDLDCGDALLH